MFHRIDSTRARGISLVVCAGVLLGALGAFATPAQAQPVPPDDGAPPEEYEPLPEGRSLESLEPEPEPEVLPESPPPQNAFPVSGATRSVCSDSFGAPRWPDRVHKGVDCFAPRGTPLVAAEAGVIRYATPGEEFSCATGGDISGNRVSVRGRSGYVYYYGHLDSILVATDQLVERGQVIGTVGSTGNASCSGPHLHFEVKCGENGEPFDPYPPLGSWSRSTPPLETWNTTRYGAGVVYTGSTRQELFATECGEVIRHKTRSGSALSEGWARVVGATASDPDAATPRPGASPQVFVRGTDGGIWQLLRDASGWWGFSLGGPCVSGPSATYTSPDRADVFCVGGDRAVYQRIWKRASGWTPWYRVGGVATSDPDVVSPSAQHAPQVFVRGPDNAIHQLIWTAQSGWFSVNLGGSCSSGPSAAYSGLDRVDVFCRGRDLALYHRYWLAETGWSSGWNRIGGLLLSDPEASSPGDRAAADVVVRGLDRRLYQFYWDGSKWASRIWGVT